MYLFLVQTACYAKPASVQTRVKQAEAFDEVVGAQLTSTVCQPGFLWELQNEVPRGGAWARVLTPCTVQNCLGGLAMRRVSLQL